MSLLKSIGSFGLKAISRLMSPAPSTLFSTLLGFFLFFQSLSLNSIQISWNSFYFTNIAQIRGKASILGIFNFVRCFDVLMLFKRKKHEKKQVPDTEEIMNKCLCIECPTNPDKACLYCARGITKKPVDQVRALGCNCAFCPVFHEYNLSGCYLCLNKPSFTN